MGWGDAVTIVPWVIYQRYGNSKYIKDNYNAMKKWISFVTKWATKGDPYASESAPDRKGHKKYLVDLGFSFGDWLVPSKTKGMSNPIATAEETKGPIGTAYYANSVYLTAKAARLLGYDNEAIEFEKLLNNIQSAYNKEYYLGNGKIKCNDLQGIYVTALAFDMLPIEERQKTINTLIQLIDDNDGCLDTGFLSVAHLLPVLSRYGYHDKAVQLLQQEKSPSWLYQVNKGATTIWESWNAINEDGTVYQSSYNHYAFGCVGDWMMKTLVGIKPTLPGFKSVDINPYFTKDLNYVTGSYETNFGKLTVSWIRFTNEIELAIEYPKDIILNVVPKGFKIEQNQTGKACCIKIIILE